MLLILYFLGAANRSVVFIWHVSQHRELFLPAPPSWKTVLRRARRSSNTHAHDNTLLYSALMNFLYSTENKPLYFPVICKVLKKIKSTHDAVSFLSLLSSSWMSEGQKVPGPTESSCGGKAAAFCVISDSGPSGPAGSDPLVQTRAVSPCCLLGFYSSRSLKFLVLCPAGPRLLSLSLSGRSCRERRRTKPAAPVHAQSCLLTPSVQVGSWGPSLSGNEGRKEGSAITGCQEQKREILEL